jgi:hypothetical protein
MATWQNNDGLEVRYGDYHADPARQTNKLTSVKSFGNTDEFVIDFDLQHISAGSVSYSTDLDNDGTVDGFTTGDARIPAGSFIKSAVLVLDEAAAGGTSITVGTYQVDGTVVDADGLVDSTATAALTDGAYIKGAGALVEAEAHATLDTYIGIAAVGTFTAGKGKLIVEVTRNG